MRCRVCLTFRDTSLIHPRTFIHPTKPHSEPRLHGRPSFQRREGRHGVDVARLSSTSSYMFVRPRHPSVICGERGEPWTHGAAKYADKGGRREGGRLQRRTKRSKGTVARQEGVQEGTRSSVIYAAPQLAGVVLYSVYRHRRARRAR